MAGASGVRLAREGRRGGAVAGEVGVDETTRSLLLGRVAEYYAASINRAGGTQERVLGPGVVEAFGVGYCDGGMRGALPESGEMVEHFKAIGVLDARGRESFLGRLVVPIRNAAGHVVDLFGLGRDGARPMDVYLRGPRAGVFNAAAARSGGRLIVTGNIRDAMRAWAAGCRNVISLRGAGEWSAEHDALVRDVGIRELVLALDDYRAGRRVARTIEARAATLGISVRRVIWPEGIGGAGEFFASRAAADLEALLPLATAARDAPVSGASAAAGVSATPEGLAAAIGDRRYELCAIHRPGPSRLRATVRAVCPSSGRFHIDTVDFYLSRSRRVFVADAARFYGREPDVIEADVHRLITAVEAHLGRAGAAGSPVSPEVAESERIGAERLGRHPDLVGEIQRDMDRLGIIGEETNRLLLYLAMTSRKAAEPLAVQILSSSGAGKSHLLDAVLALCPCEDMVKLTSLSGQALFYKGRDSLRHKCLAIAEAAGAREAGYALRSLISEKRLVIETTVRNALSGRLETQINTVDGPTAVFETTTRPDTDPETRSRYVLLSLDESPAQTRAIMEAQRQGHTLEGLRRQKARQEVIARHHAFQRLLGPVAVVNPFEPLLSYGDDRLVFRRDHPKYLNLVLAVCFLHQMGRRRRQDPALGEYIEVSLADIAIANTLAHDLFGQSPDELSVPARGALEHIVSHLRDRSCETGIPPDRQEFGRRELREAFGWSDTRLRVYLRELVEMEYLTVVGGHNGLRYRYRLVDAGAPGPRRVPGLKDVETLRREADLAGVCAHPAVAPPQRCGGVSAVANPLAVTAIGERGRRPAAAERTYRARVGVP